MRIGTASNLSPTCECSIHQFDLYTSFSRTDSFGKVIVGNFSLRLRFDERSGNRSHMVGRFSLLERGDRILVLWTCIFYRKASSLHLSMFKKPRENWTVNFLVPVFGCLDDQQMEKSIVGRRNGTPEGGFIFSVRPVTQ